MSVRAQCDERVNQIILKSFKLLRFKTVFKDYDNNRSKSSEFLSVLAHTNEFQQLKENTYYKQTSENLKTNYGAIFDNIGQITLNLERRCNINKEIKKLNKKIKQLDLDTTYLKQTVFDTSSENMSQKARRILCRKSHRDFILVKKHLKKAIKKYLEVGQMNECNFCIQSRQKCFE